MKRAFGAVIAFVALVFVVSGCGTKVPGVPGTVATVNGIGISASTYFDRLHRRLGKEVLRGLIEQQVILQWAAEEKVSPTSKQIQDHIDLLKRLGTYDEQARVIGEENLKSEIQEAQARINLARKFIKITPDQLKGVYDNLNQMNRLYKHGRRKQIQVILNRDSSKLEEALKKIKEGKDFREVAAEYSEAQMGPMGTLIIDWVDFDNPTALPPQIVKAAKETKVGEVSGVVSFGQKGQPSQNAIIKVVLEQPKVNKSLKEVKSEVEAIALLQSSRYDPAFVKKLNDKLKDAKIEVNIEDFKDLVQSFKNPPDPSAMMMPPVQGGPR